MWYKIIKKKYDTQSSSGYRRCTKGSSTRQAGQFVMIVSMKKAKDYITMQIFDHRRTVTSFFKKSEKVR
jgi:hypothetical protein